MTTRLNNVAIYDSNPKLATLTNPPKHRLVAQWLIDENSKLYCQWLVETKLKDKSIVMLA